MMGSHVGQDEGWHRAGSDPQHRPTRYEEGVGPDLPHPPGANPASAEAYEYADQRAGSDHDQADGEADLAPGEEATASSYVEGRGDPSQRENHGYERRHGIHR